MEQITLYTITSCTDCERVKQILNRSGVLYHEINVFEFPERQKEIFNLVGEFQVPLLVYRNKVCTEEAVLKL